ncbi:penicillin-binding protein 1C [Zooshikella harenae]|uniref:peptidoglycan glycosyltransferase n=1 Tax=Zooshikella harenae TaxID=2827238 RepID=A0ABS5ZH86_9GAMM|nr:penicillin-binding protein 1C [Zooshikella harenae]MBU2713419.1 penicillin-binding protein 1C [Zooshikella harenae]
MKKLLKKYLLRCSVAGFLAVPLGFWAADKQWPLPLPDASLFASTVVANDGTPLRSFADHNGVWRYPVQLDQVSPLYIDALLNYEDRWFYKHPGINPIALLRATWQNIRYGHIVSGGSTITMQVARLLDPHPRTLSGKLRQMFRALQLEWHFSKQEILTLYINLAPFGGPIEGVQAASFTYLGKSARFLSHSEAALLAVLPQAPSRLRPDRHPERAANARNKVLHRLAAFNVWPKETINSALEENVIALRIEASQHAPLLARRLHLQSQKSLNLSKQSNLNQAQNVAHSPSSQSLSAQLDALLEPIHSTIDPQTQLQVSTLVSHYQHRLQQGASVAALVVRNKDLAVVAYQGTVDFGNRQRFGHVDMVTATRSPGSTLKPFLYGIALEQGLIHSVSLLSDAPLHEGDYQPSNFSGGFYGPVSASEALQRSLNVPAVQLLKAVGPKPFADRLRNAGMLLQLPHGGKANLSMILGGVGTRLEDLVSAYTSLARNGLAGELRFTPDAPLKERYLLSPQAAWIIRQILTRSDNQALAAHTQSIPLAWKTGTSYGFRDAWAVGVMPDYTIGVWVGRPDGTPSPGEYGLVTAWPLLRAISSALPKQSGFSSPPPGVAQQVICWPLGTDKSRQENQQGNCHQQHTAWTIHQHTPPTLFPTAQGQQLVNPAPIQVNKAGQRVSLACSGETTATRHIALWPQVLEPWLPKRWQRRDLLPPFAAGCLPNQQLGHQALRISSLQDQMLIKPQAKTEGKYIVNLQTQGGYGHLAWYLNGRNIGSSHPGQSVVYTLPRPGEYQVAVTDTLGHVDKVTITVLAP